MSTTTLRETAVRTVAVASVGAILPVTAAHAAEDPWLAIEEGWIWEVVDDTDNLAGRWALDKTNLPGGVTYEMRFEVTDIRGDIGVFLGDNPRVVIDSPGTYRYTFTAEERQRMVFKAVGLEGGRAKLAARGIRVSTVADDVASVSADPWLAIEEGWIWELADEPRTLAGSASLDDAVLPGGYEYGMTFRVTDVEGVIAVNLGDREPVVVDSPGTYGYTFTANQIKEMRFEVVALEGGRAKLAANRIRVDVRDPESKASTAVARIAYSADGNQHDADDWSASPLVLAMLEASAAARLVHFDYNNHLGDNNEWMAGRHRQIVAEAQKRFDSNGARFFDDQFEAADAVHSIAKAVNASSADDRLYLVCAGPMEMCWRGIDAAMDEREPFVTVITHSWWNNNHSDTAALAHTVEDIVEDFDVEVRHIGNQNDTAFRSPAEEWLWLQQHGDDGQWLYETITAGSRPAKPGDASDAGMVYYVLDGREADSDTATMSAIRAVFNQL